MKPKLMMLLKLARKQMPVLVCILIVIAAVVLSFWPTQGWYTNLQGDLNSSLSANTQIQSLLTKQRFLPVVGGTSTVQTPLPFFPTQDVINVGMQAVNQVQAESKSMLDWATKLNVHVPLDVHLPFTIDDLIAGNVPSALTNGRTDDVARATWVHDYLQALSDDYRFRNWPPPEVQFIRSAYYQVPPLMADRRVTDQEINDAEAKLQNDINNQFLVRDPTGNITSDSQTQATNAYAAQSLQLPLDMETARAAKCKVYLEAGAIKQPAIYTSFASATSSQAASDIWTAQLFLWVDEDAVSAVARANANAKDVTESPVKQILDVTVKDPPYLINGDPTAGNDTSALTPAMDLTPTGRVCNGMYDVMQFSMTLDVDATKVPQVIDDLQSGQFLTVLTAQFQAIDSTDMVLNRFRYGKSPVVRLTLVCEDLFLHSWTAKYLPDGAGASKYAANGASQGSGGTDLITVTTHQ
ncbi:MAG TPA: hypothetical protein VL992_08710 [Tepidisphaeraceae bacterium]|nr:hypothetical protein [Tepidisphaeraceae bacterium]